jgi:hypothetical protein
MNTNCMTTEELDAYVTATGCPEATRELAERANDLDHAMDEIEDECDDLRASFNRTALDLDNAYGDFARIEEQAKAALTLLEAALDHSCPGRRREYHNDAVAVVSGLLAIAQEDRRPS